MADYFASDIHLRLDRPDRADRFARFVEGLGPGDSLTLGGDLCDFWFATRQRPRLSGPSECRGLRALAEFRARGGGLTLIVGNHDLWLGPFYREALGAEVVEEPLERLASGLRVHLVHGHLLGGRKRWKEAMESRAFFEGFGRLPGPLARAFEATLEAVNERGIDASERRHLQVFRGYAAGVADRADLCLFGHVHRPVDVPAPPVRWIALGAWIARSSYLRIDEAGAELVVEGPLPRPLDW